jgi:tetratricopeptide (TPR) repeat protein
MALESITVDGWESVTEKRDGDYRDLLKDSAKAELLEKEDKITKSTKDTDVLIANVLAQIEEEPDNLTHYRELANLYTTTKMFDEAVSAISTAQEKRGSTDPELDAAVCNIRLKQFDHAIDEATKTGDDETAQQIAVDRAEFLFTNLQERARTYPNDLHIRYDLGVALLEREDYNGAIQQFQRSQRNPRYRTESLYCMGMCFKAKTQYDLAIEQLDSAASEIVGMNKLKKDIYYELGLVHEDLQDADKAAGYFKEIYQTDIGYKDVAQKVEQIYGSG